MSVEVAKTPWVQRFFPNRMGAAASVAFVPDQRLDGRGIIAIRKGRGRSGTARIFPLGFGREIEGAASFPREPRQKSFGVIEGHDHHGMIVGLGEPGIAPGEFLALHQLGSVPAESARAADLRLGPVTALRDEPRELAASDRELPEVKRACQSHFALDFVRAAARLARGRALLESSGLDPKQWELDTIAQGNGHFARRLLRAQRGGERTDQQQSQSGKMRLEVESGSHGGGF
jgi:hypothetical protein